MEETITMKKTIILLSSAIIVVIAWFLASPLFINETVDEPLVIQAPELLKQGEFQNADDLHQGSGKALIYQLTDGSHILRLEDFTVTNGPDLMVYLVKSGDVTKSADVSDNFINLGDLKGNIGNQNYAIPAGTDIPEYSSAVIWCELFGVLFSPAPLSTK